MKVRITDSKWTKGKEGEASFDATKGKWIVQFDPVWVGWYDRNQFEILDNAAEAATEKTAPRPAHFISGTFQLHAPEKREKRRIYPANIQVSDCRVASVSGNARQRRQKVRQWKKAGLTVLQHSSLQCRTIPR